LGEDFIEIGMNFLDASTSCEVYSLRVDYTNQQELKKLYTPGSLRKVQILSINTFQSSTSSILFKKRSPSCEDVPEGLALFAARLLFALFEGILTADKVGGSLLTRRRKKERLSFYYIRSKLRCNLTISCLS